MLQIVEAGMLVLTPLVRRKLKALGSLMTQEGDRLRSIVGQGAACKLTEAFKFTEVEGTSVAAEIVKRMIKFIIRRHTN